MLNQVPKYLKALLDHPPRLVLHLIHEPLDSLLNAVPAIPLPQFLFLNKYTLIDYPLISRILLW